MIRLSIASSICHMYSYMSQMYILICSVFEYVCAECVLAVWLTCVTYVSPSIGTLFHSHHKYWTHLTSMFRLMWQSRSRTSTHSLGFLFFRSKTLLFIRMRWMDRNLWKRYNLTRTLSLLTRPTFQRTGKWRTYLLKRHKRNSKKFAFLNDQANERKKKEERKVPKRKTVNEWIWFDRRIEQRVRVKPWHFHKTVVCVQCIWIRILWDEAKPASVRLTK